MKEPRPEPKKAESYRPAPSLVRYLNETLRLLGERKKLRMQGIDISEEKKAEFGQKYKDKITVLNNHVFRSMASLVYFFEFCNKNPEFGKEFEEDIENLFLAWNESGDNKLSVFDRFIAATLHWNFKEDRDNFRLLFLFRMQELVAAKVKGFAALDFNSEVIKTVIRPDFNRASAWLKLYARKGLILPDNKEDNNYDRPVGF
jgi:hypothetical protein